MPVGRLTLITAGPSPYARKVAVALYEKAITFSTINDRPWGPDSVTSRYNPLAQLPILLVEGEEPVYDSAYILTWLELRFPDRPLLPDNPAARLEALKRQMLGERLMEIAQQLIFEHAREKPSMLVVERQTTKIVAAFETLERSYQTREALHSERIDLGDIAVATTCMVLAFLRGDGVTCNTPEFGWEGRYPALLRLCADMDTRESFRRTSPVHMEFEIAKAVS